MGRNGRERVLQPTDLARKKAKKDDAKRNKLHRKQQKELVIKAKDPKKIVAEIDELKERIRSILTPFGQAPFETKKAKAEEELQEVLEHLEKNDPDKHSAFKQWRAERTRKAKEAESATTNIIVNRSGMHVSAEQLQTNTLSSSLFQSTSPASLTKVVEGGPAVDDLDDIPMPEEEETAIPPPPPPRQLPPPLPPPNRLPPGFMLPRGPTPVSASLPPGFRTPQVGLGSSLPLGFQPLSMVSQSKSQSGVYPVSSRPFASAISTHNIDGAPAVYDPDFAGSLGAPPPPPPKPAVAKKNPTVSAAPQIRDKVAELKRFIPTSVRVKRNDAANSNVKSPAIKAMAVAPPVEMPESIIAAKTTAFDNFMSEMASL